MNIGNIIKKLRTKKRMTQEELATKCNLSKNAIWNYENDKRIPNIETLKNIAKALQVSIYSFLESENSFSMELILAINRGYKDKFNTCATDIIQNICDDLDLDYEIFTPFMAKSKILITNEDGTTTLKTVNNEDFDATTELPVNIQLKLLDYLYEIDRNTFLEIYKIYKKIDLDNKILDKMWQIYQNDFSNSMDINIYDPTTHSNQDVALDLLSSLIYYVSGYKRLPDEIYNKIFDEVCNTIKFELYKFKNNKEGD